MKVLIISSATLLILILSYTTRCHAHSGETAYAVPLEGITIDGTLEDWPESLYVYPIERRSHSIYNPILPDGSIDYSGNFQVGYDLKNNVLYVAVVVIDDDFVVKQENPNVRNQDVCGIYIDADHSGGDSNAEGRQLYVMVPGPGKWAKRLDENPSLNQGDNTASGMRGAFAIEGNTVTYEWEIPLFSTFPDQRFQIQAGKKIGFDLLIGDADGQDNATYLHWTPGGGKNNSSDLFGHLVFLNGYEDLGTLTGAIVSENGTLPETRFTIDAFQEDHKMTTIITDSMGRFHADLHPGEYTLKVNRGYGLRSVEELNFTVTAGQDLQARITAIPVEIPEILVRSMERYRSLKGYCDSTEIFTRTLKPGMDNRASSRFLFSHEKPNRIRIEGSDEMPIEVEYYSNGKMLSTYMESWKQYTQKTAPAMLQESHLRGLEGFLGKRIIMSDNPFAEMIEGLEAVQVLGTEMLDGTPTTSLELSLSISSLGSMMIPQQIPNAVMVPVKMWIGDTDYLIRKVAYDVNMEELVDYMPAEMKNRMGDYYRGLTVSTVEMHSDVKIDPIYAMNDFAFNPPQGVALVDRFSPPGRSDSKGSIIGKQAPDFTLKDLDGNETKLADLKGKVVLMDFWATWCGPCIQAMPHIQALYEIYKERDVVILGINSWERGNDNVKSFLEEHKITYRILLDSQDEVISKYGVLGIPTFFILDKEGVIRHSYTGMPANRQVIQKNLEDLLKG